MLRTATVYRIAEGPVRKLLKPEHLETLLPEETIQDPDKTAWSAVGFANVKESPVFVAADGTRVLNLQIRERILPGKVIRTKVDEVATEYSQRQGYKVGRKQLAEIKDEVVAQLLPVSHIKRTNVPLVFTGDYLLIGTSSARIVDIVCHELIALLDTAGSLFIPFAKNLELSLSSWASPQILGEPEDDVFDLGNSVVLTGPEGKVARFKDMSMLSEPITDAIKLGFAVTEIALTYANRLSFTLTDRMIVKRIAMLDVMVEEVEQNAADAMAVFEGTIALLSGEMKAVLGALSKSLKYVSEEDEL